MEGKERIHAQDLDTSQAQTQSIHSSLSQRGCGIREHPAVCAYKTKWVDDVSMLEERYITIQCSEGRRDENTLISHTVSFYQGHKTVFFYPLNIYLMKTKKCVLKQFVMIRDKRFITTSALKEERKTSPAQKVSLCSDTQTSFHMSNTALSDTKRRC